MWVWASVSHAELYQVLWGGVAAGFSPSLCIGQYSQPPVPMVPGPGWVGRGRPVDSPAWWNVDDA